MFCLGSARFVVFSPYSGDVVWKVLRWGFCDGDEKFVAGLLQVDWAVVAWFYFLSVVRATKT